MSDAIKRQKAAMPTARVHTQVRHYVELPTSDGEYMRCGMIEHDPELGVLAWEFEQVDGASFTADDLRTIAAEMDRIAKERRP